MLGVILKMFHWFWVLYDVFVFILAHFYISLGFTVVVARAWTNTITNVTCGGWVLTFVRNSLLTFFVVIEKSNLWMVKVFNSLKYRITSVSFDSQKGSSIKTNFPGSTKNFWNNQFILGYHSIQSLFKLVDDALKNWHFWISFWFSFSSICFALLIPCIMTFYHVYILQRNRFFNIIASFKVLKMVLPKSFCWYFKFVLNVILLRITSSEGSTF